MAQLSDAQRAFVRDNAFVAVATTLRPDGSPHSTPVWVDADERHVSFNTARDRAKAKHLAADPRVAVAVIDPTNAFCWVTVSGVAELVDEGAIDHINHLSKKYVGEDVYPWPRPGEQRVMVRITVDNATAQGIDEPSG